MRAGPGRNSKESIAFAMYKIMRMLKGYTLDDLLSDTFYVGQFFELCKLIRAEEKENEKAAKKAQRK